MRVVCTPCDSLETPELCICIYLKYLTWSLAARCFTLYADGEKPPRKVHRDIPP